VTQPRRERKVVTVLFADLVGFTSRAERMDPEDVEVELSRYHTQVRGDLERHGGTVEKFIGDAVMAVFGAPAAHEDDPERSVRAALAVRSWAQAEGLEVRIGVNTGEALVKLEARPESGEGMAAGDVVNTAARLQAAAPENGILVGSWTYQATRQVIDYREVPAVQAKGKAEPVAAWEAIQARAHLGVERPHGASLVGRGAELALLRGALERARRERSAQLVTVVGVPGIGKSRLVYELFKGVEADTELITWRQGRCLPYGEAVTFWALGEIVKAQAGILENDTPKQVERKLGDAVRDRRLQAYLAPLVGLGTVELWGEDRRAEAFAAWRQFLEGLAEERPLVLVVEDLHWADDSLLDFVDHLVDWASGVPILVVCSARPELLERRSTWGGGKTNALTISLSALSDDETDLLLGELVEERPLPAEMRAGLLARAEGNPLYAEQFARILLERGEVAELPETLQGIVAARLDLLETEQKALLQDAAVLGRTFWAGGLATVSGLDRHTIEERLHGLERRALMRRERPSSVADETQYEFNHVMVRDVAYAQLPRADRVDKHRRAAAWIESLGRPDDHAEMLAHHHLQALELSQAAGFDTAALVEPARLALRAAGDRAAALYAVEAAERFYDTALELWPDDDPDRADLLYRRAVPVGLHGGGDPERLREASDALLAAGHTERAAEVEMLISSAFWLQSERELADAHADRAAALLGEGPPTKSRAWVLARLAMRWYLAGELDRAAELAGEAVVVSGQAGLEEELSDSLAEQGMIRVTSGDAEGVDDIERAAELARESGGLATLTRVLNTAAVAQQMLGDLELGFRVRLEAAEAAQRLGSNSLQSWFQGVLVDHRYRRGDWDEAHRDADDFLAHVEAGSSHVEAWQVFAIRAELRLAKADFTGAVTDVEQALAAGRAVGEIQSVNFVLACSAHVLTLASRRDEAVAVAHEFLDSLRAGVNMQFADINLPMFAAAAVRLGLGDELVSALAGHRRSRWTQAVRAYIDGDFVDAAEILGRAGARPDEAEARLRAAERLRAEGRRADADVQIAEALSFYRSVGATKYVRDAEELVAART
jgi:class 3 adenylate cyclase